MRACRFIRSYKSLHAWNVECLFDVIRGNIVLWLRGIQGSTQNLMWVGSFQEKVDLFDFDTVQVCKAHPACEAC